METIKTELYEAPTTTVLSLVMHHSMKDQKCSRRTPYEKEH